MLLYNQEKHKRREDYVLKKLTWLLLVIIIFFLVSMNYNNIKLQIYKKIYKLDYEQYVEKYSKEYDVDKYLIFAIIKAESNFDDKAVSHKEAKGLMQLMYSTAQDVAEKIEIDLNEENILEPEININLGTKYISMLIQKYENINLALAAYNAGSGNVDGWINDGTLKSDGSDIENIPYTETNNYVRKILRDYDIYRETYQNNS